MKERHIDTRAAWFCWNAVAMIIPVIISTLIGGYKFGLTGILSYSYALIAVAWFLFDQHLRVTNQKIRFPNLRKIGSLTLILGILVFFIIYTLLFDEMVMSLAGMMIISTVILIAAFPVAYSLNLPLLNRQVFEEERRDEALQKIAQEQQETRSKTKQDATSAVEDTLNENN